MEPTPTVARTGFRRRLKLAVFNLVLTLIALAIPCLIGEVILRMLAPPPDTPGLFTKIPSEIEWEGKPSGQGTFAGVPVSFNAIGLRDRDRSPEPAPGTVRILALGDSVTFGLGVPEPDTYPRVAESLLNASRPTGQPPVEILNFGMPGYNTAHEAVQLREIGLKFHPDVVLVGFLYNDVEPSTAQGRRLGRERHEHEAHGGAAATPSLGRRFRHGINAGVTYLKEHSLFFGWLTPRLGSLLRPLGAKGFGQVGEVKDQYTDQNPDWLWAQAALLDLQKTCQERHVPMVVLILPAMARFTDASYPIKEYHQALNAFCAAHSITCLDLLPAFWGMDGTRFWVSPSDGHPNAQGHKVIAQALAKFLSPMLAQVPAAGQGAAR